MGKIFAIVNQKGGVGKTTTTVNLSACLANCNKKVLIVDADPQGNASSGIGINKNKLKQCLYDVIINNVPIEEVIHPTSIDNLYILPATVRLAGAEVELVSILARETQLKKVLSAISDNYDYILIDCPPSLGLLTLNALTAADAVLIPIQSEYFALEGLTQLNKTIALVQKYLNPKLKIEGLLLTMYDSRTKLSAQIEEELRKYYPDKVFNTIIPRNIRLSEAPSYGEPINLYAPKSKGSEVYMNLAKEVISNE